MPDTTWPWVVRRCGVSPQWTPRTRTIERRALAVTALVVCPRFRRDRVCRIEAAVGVRVDVATRSGATSPMFDAVMVGCEAVFHAP